MENQGIDWVSGEGNHLHKIENIMNCKLVPKPQTLLNASRSLCTSLDIDFEQKL